MDSPSLAAKTGAEVTWAPWHSRMAPQSPDPLSEVLAAIFTPPCYRSCSAADHRSLTGAEDRRTSLALTCLPCKPPSSLITQENTETPQRPHTPQLHTLFTAGSTKASAHGLDSEAASSPQHQTLEPADPPHISLSEEHRSTEAHRDHGQAGKPHKTQARPTKRNTRLTHTTITTHSSTQPGRGRRSK